MVKIITCQTNYKAENFNTDTNDAEKQAKLNNFDWTQRQYFSPDPSIYEIFLANSIGLPLKNPSAEVYACKYAYKNHAYGANHTLPNFDNILIKNPAKFNNFKRMNSNNCQTSLGKRH